MNYCNSETLLEQQQEIQKLKDERDALAAQVEAMRMAIMSNCYDDPSTSGQRLMELANKTPQHHLRQVRADAGRDGFIEGFRYDDEIHFNGAPSDIKIAADKYHASILAGKE